MTQERGLANDPVSFDELVYMNVPDIYTSLMLARTGKDGFYIYEVWIESEDKCFGLWIS